MGLTDEREQAAKTLAEHYLDGGELPRPVMLDAWRALLPSDPGADVYWSDAEIEAAYEPMVQQDDYADDAEDCGGCHKLDDMCERHRSFERGVASMVRAVRTMGDEPEVMGEVLHLANRLDAAATHDPASPEHDVTRCLVCRDEPAGTRIQVDAECPDCEHPRQWFEPGKREFSCQRCDYRSPYPHGQHEEQPAENTGVDLKPARYCDATQQ